MGVIPNCADNGGTPPCVPELDGSAPCPNVAITTPNDYATEVLKSCGIASSAAELVEVGNLRGNDANHQSVHQCRCQSLCQHRNHRASFAASYAASEPAVCPL